MAYMTDENGNYKRTVRCGHCYEKGHNKSACPDRKKQLADNIEAYTKELAENKFADEWRKRNTERYLQSSKDQLSKMMNRGKNRSCSYCGETGHNKRSCANRKQDANNQADKTIKLRQHALAHMSSIGLGPGTLVSWPGHTDAQGNKVDFLAMVERVSLDRVHHSHAVDESRYTFYSPEVVSVRMITNIMRWGDRLERTTVRLPIEAVNVDGLDISDRNLSSPPIEVVSPVAKVSIPDEMFDRATLLKGIFESIDG
jgi:hypothetical protein